MPLPPVPGSNPPALPPRRGVPPPPASPSPPPQPVAEDYEEPTIPPREPHNIIITVQEEYYDEFDVEDELPKTPSHTAAATGESDEDYDEFGVQEEGPQVYELDNSPSPTPPPLPSQHRRGPLPKPPPQEEVYDVAGEEEEEDASAGSYHSAGAASSGSDDQPPPVPPINNRRPKPNPPSRAAEKKFTPPSVPGGVIDVRAISEGLNKLKKVHKSPKPEEPKENIKPLVVLKPDKPTTNAPKPTPPSKPGPPTSFLKKNIFKTFMSSINKDKELPAVPPLPLVNNNKSSHDSNISKSEDTTHSDGVNDDHVTSNIEPEVNTSEDDDPGEIYDECVSASDPLAKYPWYMNVDRQTSINRIKTINKDGTFLIRNSGSSKTTNTSHPYTLCVLYENRIRNLKIRQRSDKKFALGNYKDNEMTFDSIEKLVEHHKKNDVLLIGEYQGNVKLLHVASNR